MRKSFPVGATMVLVWFAIVAGFVFFSCAAPAPRFRPHPGPVQSAGRYNADTAAQFPDDDQSFDPALVLSTIAENETAYSTVDARRVMDEIQALIGTPYAAGDENEGGIDCSGFTARIYRKALATVLPRSTAEQFHVGIPVAREEIHLGDLVFFNTTGDVPSHVGIYLGEGLFAHASVSSGVTISSLSNRYYRNRFVGARRPIP